MKTVLIFGASGYLGLFYSRRLLNNKKFNIKIDFSDLIGKKQFELNDIDVVLYFAVIHQVEKENPILREINTFIPIFLAEECKKRQIQFIYISTEQVFAHQENHLYKESEKQNAITIYGMSKAAAEKVISNFNNVCILRTSMIYGYKHPKRQNLFTLINFGSFKQTEVYKDAFTKPTLIDELCDSIDYIIEKKLSGIYHFVGAQMIDRFSLLKQFYKQKYSDIIINYLIKPALTPKNSYIQKYINIETSEIVKPFQKISLEDGLKLQMNRTYE